MPESFILDFRRRQGRLLVQRNPYTATVPQVFFTAAGIRNHSDGTAYYLGNYGFYWSSRPYSNYAYSLDFAVVYAGMGNDDRANGYSVRCVQE